MPYRSVSSTDMVALARLHAALDSVVETEVLISELRDSQALASLPLSRAATLVTETRELLRSLLAAPARRQVSGT